MTSSPAPAALDRPQSPGHPGANDGRPDGPMIASAVHLLSERNFFGAVWLDHELIVTHKIGVLADFVTLGATVTDSIFVLIGQESRIAALGHAVDDVLSIPNVALMGSDGETSGRFNVSVCRRAEETGYLVLLGRILWADVRDLVLEDEIRKRRIADAELQRINARLEEFAYVISHDLKAPLRALRYLSDAVTEAVSKRRPALAAAREAADGIKAQAKRMSNMLVGLLEYSRIGREREAVEAVDTAALADEIIGSLSVPVGFTIRREGVWPSIETARVPLDVVLRNLIENAIKHHDLATGTVVVFAEPGEKFTQFSIRDDGPGIPPEWQEAIFEPFRRIADEPSSDSSGIGLALVRRTVETIGGHIAVRSIPEATRGTTFVVTWPRHING